MFDRGIGRPIVNQGGHEGRLNAEDTFGHFRGVARIDYLSSFVFRLTFNDVFGQAVNSEVKSEAFLSNPTRGYFYNASMQRYQNFESTTPDDVMRILHAPSFESLSVDREIGGSPLYWSYDAAAEGLNRRECTNVDQTVPRCTQVLSPAPLVGPFDFRLTLSLPLVVGGWSVRAFST